MFLVAASMSLAVSMAPPDGSGAATAPPAHRALATSFEPDPALPTELPPGFFRLLTRESGRDGFPPFGGVRASEARSTDGRWGLEFRTAGGAMAVVSEPSLVAAAPGERFRASAAVLVDGLDRSCAMVAIRALDGAGRPIQGAAWGAEARNERGWQRLEFDAGPVPDGTRAIEVSLEVRPSDEADPTGDVAGGAVFDDLQLWRVPRVRIDIDRAGAPVGEMPRGAIVAVHDPAPPCETGLRLLDQDGREIGRWTLVGDGEFEVPFPPLAPGSYELQASIDEAATALMRSTRVVAVGDRPALRDPREPASIRFGLWVDRPSSEDGAAASLLDAIRLVRPDFVIVDLGDGAANEPDRLGLEAMRRWCDELRLEGVEPILRFSRVPGAIAEAMRVERDDPAGVLEAGGDAWRRAYGAWFERFGHVQRRWMIASTPARAVAVPAPLAALVPGLSNEEGVVEVIDAVSGSARAHADDAVHGAIERWREGSAMLALRGAIAEEPSSAALAWGMIASAARGAKSMADLDAGSELGCLLLSCEDSARVLAWRRDGGAPAPCALPFDGESLVAVDALGAPVPLERRGGTVVAAIGATPVIVDGVDPTLGAFLAAIRFAPARLHGTTAEQSIALELTNPWEVTWEGTLRFVAPVDWSFVPRFQRFTLAPGASATARARVTLPRTAPTGVHRVGVELEFTADRGRSIRVDPPIAVVVDEFTCEAQLRRVTLADGRAGAVVEVVLANRSDRALELETTVSTLSGMARRDGPVRLEPGASARRTVRLDEAPGGAVVVSVAQTNGPLRLVRTIR